MCVTPHVAQNTAGRSSAIDGRTTRHAGYALSQQRRKLIEEAFGWAKTIGGLARPMRRGAARMGQAFTLAMAAYDLIRLPNSSQPPPREDRRRRQALPHPLADRLKEE